MLPVRSASTRLLLLFSFSLTSYCEVLFPVPDGPYAVARSSVKLVDESRIDPYDPNNGTRMLMTSLFYPVPKNECKTMCAADYMPPTSAAAWDSYTAVYNFSFGASFKEFKLPLCCDPSCSATANATKFPLVLFGNGLSASRGVYGGMVQKLASAGYAIATMDHPYESLITEFPDGTYILGKDGSYWSLPHELGLLPVRVDDGRFVLSQLGRKDVVQQYLPGASDAFNISNAGFYGHSFGGATALAALMEDERFAGGMNIDGTQFGNITDIHSPAVLFGRGDPSVHNSSNEVTWPDTWDHLKGWRRELSLAKTEHLGFGDFPVWAKLTNVSSNATDVIFGSLDGVRFFKIVTTYVQAFMDFAIKGKKSELFDGPSKAYPEITIR